MLINDIIRASVLYYLKITYRKNKQKTKIILKKHLKKQIFVNIYALQ